MVQPIKNLYCLFTFNIHVISAKGVLNFAAQTMHVKQLFISPEGNDSKPHKLKLPQDGSKLCKEHY